MDVAVMPPVVPERGGEITVTRRTGNYVYGEWRVTAPDGIEQIVPDKNINPGYLYRPPGAGSGRFDVAFVRMDASIELDHVSPSGATSGRSDVELQMDAGQKRSEGRVLVEREISARGIGRLQPGVHFTTGSLLKLRIWDFFIHLPLTAFDWRRNRHGAGWAFRCGGQLISDPETLRSLNSEAQSQIDSERRRAAEEAKRLEEQQARDRKVAGDAKAAADSAASAAAAADRAAASARSRADSAYSTAGTANSRAGTLEVNEDNIFTWANDVTKRIVIFDHTEHVANYTARSFRHIFAAFGHLYDAIEDAQRGNNVSSDINSAKSDITLAEEDTSTVESQYSGIARANFTIHNPLRSVR